MIKPKKIILENLIKIENIVEEIMKQDEYFHKELENINIEDYEVENIEINNTTISKSKFFKTKILNSNLDKNTFIDEIQKTNFSIESKF